MPKKILIMGARGLLGASLAPFLSNQGCDVFRQSRTVELDIQVDPNNVDMVHKVCKKIAPDVIINLIASTDVDVCERDGDLCYQANIKPAIVLSEVKSLLNKTTTLIHLSTDHFYDGSGYKSEDTIFLANNYAFSKLAAEAPISLAGGIILRTNFFGRSLSDSRKSFTDWIYSALMTGPPITVFDNVFFTPLHISRLCSIIYNVILNPISGIYNVGSAKGLSKSEFAFEFARQLNLPVNQMASAPFIPGNGLINRPLDMRMNSKKFEEAYRIKMPSIYEEIKLAAQEYF